MHVFRFHNFSIKFPCNTCNTCNSPEITIKMVGFFFNISFIFLPIWRVVKGSSFLCLIVINFLTVFQTVLTFLFFFKKYIVIWVLWASKESGNIVLIGPKLFLPLCLINLFYLKSFLYKLSFTFIDLAMQVVIHGLELYIFGFLLMDFKGACPSSNAWTIFRKCSIKTFGSGLLQCSWQLELLCMKEEGSIRNWIRWSDITEHGRQSDEGWKRVGKHCI